MVNTLTAALVMALLGVTAVAGAQDDDFLDLDRITLTDGSAVVSVSRQLEGREALFALSVSRERQDGDEVVNSGGEGMYPMRIAGGRRHARLRIERTMCDEPVAIIGTVTRRVARVERVAADGTVTRLRRHRAPSGWRSRVRVIGSMQPSAGAVREVRARLRGGRVVARVRPEPATPCPQE